jgi:competence protein ComEA
MNSPSRGPAWRGYVGLSLAWLAILGAALFLTHRPATQPIEIIPPPTPLPTETPPASPTPGPLRIDVAGAVAAPGVYVLPAGSIVADAIAAAGGPADAADLDRVNKAVPLQDGMQIHVPRIADTPSAAVLLLPATPASTTHTAEAGAAAGDLIDLNTATLAELDTLPGVGPATAQRIVDGRPYGKIEDLLRIKGIGQATFDKLKDHITVR